MRVFVLAVVIVLVMSPAVATAAPAPLTVGAAEAAITVTGAEDPLETVITFSSEPVMDAPVYGEEGPTFAVAYPFVRAWRQKQTAGTTYQVYVNLQYGDRLRAYESATYLDGATAQTTRLTVIDRGMAGCAPGLGCLLQETVGFEVPERILRAAAADPTPGRLWTFRLRSRLGGTVNVSLPTAEIAGLLRRVDTYPTTPAGRK